MRISEIKMIKDREKAVELLRSGKVKGDNIVILWQYTGLAWLNPIITTDNNRCDIVTMLDNIYYNISNDNDLPFPLYDIDEIDAIDDRYLYESYLPINGGEYYTNMISHIERLI